MILFSPFLSHQPKSQTSMSGFAFSSSYGVKKVTLICWQSNSFLFSVYLWISLPWRFLFVSSSSGHLLFHHHNGVKKVTLICWHFEYLFLGVPYSCHLPPVRAQEIPIGNANLPVTPFFRRNVCLPTQRFDAPDFTSPVKIAESTYILIGRMDTDATGLGLKNNVFCAWNQEKSKLIYHCCNLS